MLDAVLQFQQAIQNRFGTGWTFGTVPCYSAFWPCPNSPYKAFPIRRGICRWDSAWDLPPDRILGPSASATVWLTPSHWWSEAGRFWIAQSIILALW